MLCIRRFLSDHMTRLFLWRRWYTGSDLSFLSLFLPSGESEPGDGERVGGGGWDGHHQLSGEEQRRLCDPAAQPQQTDHLLQRREAWVLNRTLLPAGAFIVTDRFHRFTQRSGGGWKTTLSWKDLRFDPATDSTTSEGATSRNLTCDL